MSNDKRFDVDPPGSRPADQTSRPIIVNQSSLKPDPMMRGKGSVLKTLQSSIESLSDDSSRLESQTNNTQESSSDIRAMQTDEETPNKKIDNADDLPKNVAIPKTNELNTKADDKIEQLIKDKIYNLPIKPSKTKRALLIVVSCLVAIIGVVSLVYFVIK